MMKKINIPTKLLNAIKLRKEEIELHDVCYDLIVSGFSQTQLLDFIGLELQKLSDDDDYDEELYGVTSMLLGHCSPKYSLAEKALAIA